MRMNMLGGLIAAFASMALPTAASAMLFTLRYTTFADGVNAPVSVDAVLTADADPFAANGYVVSGISGTRGTTAIDGIADPFSEIYYPATVLPGYQFATNLDAFGITFTAGGTDYQVYRGQSDTSFYHELENPDGIGTGRLILPGAFSLSALPEPASWATMAIGLGLAGASMRRRRARATA